MAALRLGTALGTAYEHLEEVANRVVSDLRPARTDALAKAAE
jgi:hypothetical protein